MKQFTTNRSDIWFLVKMGKTGGGRERVQLVRHCGQERKKNKERSIPSGKICALISSYGIFNNNFKIVGNRDIEIQKYTFLLFIRIYVFIIYFPLCKALEQTQERTLNPYIDGASSGKCFHLS